MVPKREKPATETKDEGESEEDAEEKRKREEEEEKRVSGPHVLSLCLRLVLITSAFRREKKRWRI